MVTDLSEDRAADVPRVVVCAATAVVVSATSGCGASEFVVEGGTCAAAVTLAADWAGGLLFHSI